MTELYNWKPQPFICHIFVNIKNATIEIPGYLNCLLSQSSHKNVIYRYMASATMFTNQRLSMFMSHSIWLHIWIFSGEDFMVLTSNTNQIFPKKRWINSQNYDRDWQFWCDRWQPLVISLYNVSILMGWINCYQAITGAWRVLQLFFFLMMIDFPAI